MNFTRNILNYHGFSTISVFTVIGSIIKFNEYLTDAGSNISIPCLARGSIIWVKEECNSTKEYQVIYFFMVQFAAQNALYCFITIFGAARV